PPHGGLRRDQPPAVRPAGGGDRAGGGIPHGVLGHALLDVLHGRVRQHDHRLRPGGDALLRRVPCAGAASSGPAASRLGPRAGPGVLSQSRFLPVRVCLGALDAATLPLRPAHEPGLESAAACCPAARRVGVVRRPDGLELSVPVQLLLGLIVVLVVFAVVRAYAPERTLLAGVVLGLGALALLAVDSRALLSLEFWVGVIAFP